MESISWNFHSRVFKHLLLFYRRFPQHLREGVGYNEYNMHESKNLKTYILQKEKEKISFVSPMIHCRERQWELFVNLASLSQQGGDLTCPKALSSPCSPTTFTLLASSLLSLSRSSYSVIGEKIDRYYRYVQALSFSEIKGCLNPKLN